MLCSSTTNVVELMLDDVTNIDTSPLVSLTVYVSLDNDTIVSETHK